MLSGVSRATLHRVFACAMLSQEYYNITEQNCFMCNVVWSLLDNIAQGFYLCNVVPRVLRQHWTKLFPCNVVWRLLDNIAQGFYLWNVVQGELRQYWTGLFLVQCCLEPHGQHCLGYLLVQCCPKSFKTALNRIFPYAVLSGISWATLHNILTCAILAHS